MNQFKPAHLSGNTPLDPNELNGLIPDYITTYEELNAIEQENILEAMDWAYRTRHLDILNITFNHKLHKKMFYKVWKWAGTARKTDKNIGVHWTQIPAQLNDAFENTKYWIEKNIYHWDELAARFHHKLVSIHVFPNGNGRHARLMTDVLLKINDQKIFTWGAKNNQIPNDVEGKVRNSYLSALKEADSGSFSKLIKFVTG